MGAAFCENSTGASREGKESITRNDPDSCDSALLIIDIQREFFSNDEVVKENSPDFEESITALLSSARDLARKNKLHIIHVREIDTDGAHWIPFWDEMNPDALYQPAQGAAEDFCKVEEGEKLVIKQTFDAFHETELHEYLQSTGIRTLYFCGLATSMCVLHSLLSAFARGYRTLIIGECCGDWSRENHSAILKALDGNMAKVVTMKQFENEVQSTRK